MNDVFEKVRDLLSVELAIPKDEITLDQNIFDDLNVDSLDSVEIQMSLELEYDIDIKEKDFEKIKTVNDIVEYVKNKIKK